MPIKSPEQLVTLASIIEKETGRPEERTRVAVFANRLKQKMKLQSDPTIIYGLVGGRPRSAAQEDDRSPPPVVHQEVGRAVLVQIPGRQPMGAVPRG